VIFEKRKSRTTNLPVDKQGRWLFCLSVIKNTVIRSKGLCLAWDVEYLDKVSIKINKVLHHLTDCDFLSILLTMSQHINKKSKHI
jgi:hypothetical protein